MIFGISMGVDICLILGQVSHNLLYATKKLLTDICGPGAGSQWKSAPSPKEKQKWSNEKLHLENAQKLRGIYYIHPEDTEFKETIKNARKKLETSVAPAMPCKILKNCGSGASNKI